jgi:hypothetical protein
MGSFAPLPAFDFVTIRPTHDRKHEIGSLSTWKCTFREALGGQDTMQLISGGTSVPATGFHDAGAASRPRADFIAARPPAKR